MNKLFVRFDAHTINSQGEEEAHYVIVNRAEVSSVKEMDVRNVLITMKNGTTELVTETTRSILDKLNSG